MCETIDERQNGLSFVVSVESGCGADWRNCSELKKAHVHRLVPVNVHFVVLGAPVAQLQH